MKSRSVSGILSTAATALFQRESSGGINAFAKSSNMPGGPIIGHNPDAHSRKIGLPDDDASWRRQIWNGRVSRANKNVAKGLPAIRKVDVGVDNNAQNPFVTQLYSGGKFRPNTVMSLAIVDAKAITDLVGVHEMTNGMAIVRPLNKQALVRRSPPKPSFNRHPYRTSMPE